MDGLYKVPTNGVQFTTFCGGNQSEENQESCVSLGKIPGGVVIRGTKPEDSGRELRFTDAEWSAFIAGVTA